MRKVLFLSVLFTLAVSTMAAAGGTLGVILRRVVDGDTIVVSVRGRHEVVHLLYVKMEGSSSRDERLNTAFGKETFKEVKRWLTPKTRIRLEFEEGRKRDSHGVLWAYVLLIDEERRVNDKTEYKAMNFNLMLIHAGLSPYYTGHGRSKRYHEEFKYAEDYARSKKHGIWGDKERAKRYLELKKKWDDRADRIEKAEKGGTKDPEDTKGLKDHKGATNKKSEAYVSARNSLKFHISTCRYARRIKREDRVSYKTSEDAIWAGRKPCRLCKP